jgi:general secretion pathway protein A
MELLPYYRLNEPPFRISPDPRFLFLNDQTKEALAKITYMTRERIGPLYMYGPIGSGKTSILRRLYEQLREDKHYNVQLLFTPNVRTSNALLRIIMDAFGVKTDRAYDRCLKHFEAFLIAQYKAGVVPTVFVDEAQNMTRDILKLVHYLLNFETNTVKLLQIVLAGQEELSAKVMRYPELASRMFPIAMNPLSPTDLQEMIAFRWSVASGARADAPFSASVYKGLFVYSKGLPRDAIKLADELLRHMYIHQRRQATLEDVSAAAKQLNLAT